jgi:hypothetical protein
MSDVSYSAEYTLKIDQLKKSVVEAQKRMEALNKEFSDGKIELEEYERQAKSLESELKNAGSAITRMSGSGNKLAGVFGDFLPNSVKKGMKALKSLEGGINMDAAVSSVKAFGSSLVSGLSAGVKGALRFGVALNAATGGLLLIVGAIVGLAVVIAKASKAQGEFNAKVNGAKAAQDALTASVGATQREQEKRNTSISETNKLQNASALILKKIGDTIGGVIQPAVDAVKAAWEAFAGKVNDVLKWLGLVTDEELESAAAAVKHVESYNAIKDAAAAYKNELAIIDKTETGVTAKKQAQLSALNSYISKLAEQSVLMGGQDAIVEETIARLVKERDSLQQSLETSKEIMSEQEKIQLARAAAEEKYKETIARVNAELSAGEIENEEKAQELRDAAMAAWKNDLQGIVDEYNLVSGVTVELLKAKREIVAATETQKRNEEAVRLAMEAAEAAADEIAALKDQTLNAELDVRRAIAVTLAENQKIEQESLAIAQEHELAALRTSDAYKNATVDEKEQMEAVLATKQAYERQALAATQAKETEAAAARDAAKSVEEWKKAVEKAADAVSTVGGAMVEIAGSFASIMDSQNQDLIDDIDEALAKQLESLQEQRQAALEAAGFAAAATEEGTAAALRAVIETGDEELIYAEKRRQEELAINKRFDKQERDAKENAEKEKQQLEYESAMATWRNQLLQAGVSIAAAILQGYAQTGPLAGHAGAAIMTTVGAAQIAAIMASEPTPPPSGASGGGGAQAPSIAAAGGSASAEAIMPSSTTIDTSTTTSVATTASAASHSQSPDVDRMGGIIIYIDNVAAAVVGRINDGQTQRIDMRMIGS